jgi:hypothetical protein
MRSRHLQQGVAYLMISGLLLAGVALPARSKGAGGGHAPTGGHAPVGGPAPVGHLGHLGVLGVLGAISTNNATNNNAPVSVFGVTVGNANSTANNSVSPVGVTVGNANSTTTANNSVSPVGVNTTSATVGTTSTSTATSTTSTSTSASSASTSSVGKSAPTAAAPVGTAVAASPANAGRRIMLASAEAATADEEVGRLVEGISAQAESTLNACWLDTPDCVADALDRYAAALQQIAPRLPPALRSLPGIVATAARKARAARSPQEAVLILRHAIAQVHKSIALLRADEPMVPEAATRAGGLVVATLQVAQDRLERAVGL